MMDILILDNGSSAVKVSSKGTDNVEYVPICCFKERNPISQFMPNLLSRKEHTSGYDTRTGFRVDIGPILCPHNPNASVYFHSISHKVNVLYVAYF
jgi:hypothetical protein